MGASPGRVREANQGLGLGLGLPTGRGRSGSGSGDSLIIDAGKGWDLLKFMHEVAKGMAYLHSKGVLHGDLKVAFYSLIWTPIDDDLIGLQCSGRRSA